jgi:sugar phosphate isomerase/epimerase
MARRGAVTAYVDTLRPHRHDMCDPRERVFVSSSAFKARTVAAVVAECERRGVERLELTSSFPYYEGTREEVVEARRRGMRLLIHNYFPPPQHGFVLNLASGDPVTRRRSIEHCRAALVLSSDIGAPYYSVHAGFALDPKPSDLGGRLAVAERRTMHDTAQVFFESVELLCDTAQTVGVDLLIENNVISPPNLIDGRNELLLCVTAEGVHELFDAVRSSRLGVLLDVAHLNVSAMTLGLDRERTITQLRPFVRALHLSDNNGVVDDNRPFDRDAWFLPHLASFPEAELVIETRALDPLALAACMSTVATAAMRTPVGR